MNILAVITADDINTWKELALVGIGALTAVLLSLAGMVFTVWAFVQPRIAELHGTVAAQQTQLTALSLASVPAGATPTAAPSLRLNHDALAAALAPSVVNAVTTLIKSQPNWPTPQPTLPPKAQ